MPASDAPQPRRGSSDEPTVKSAERTLRILEELATSPTRLTLAELQDRTGYPRSSLHVLVRTLVQLGWVEHDAAGYSVGTHALSTGTAYLDRDPALPFAHRALEDLRAEVGHTVHFARRVDASVLYLASRESHVHAREIFRVGRRLPAHATALGQALLAELTPREVDELLPGTLEARTEHTITTRDRLQTELEHVRERGWSWEIEQGTLGLGCVAVAVPYRIPATDAISCSMPVEVSRDRQTVAEIADAVDRHAARLATALRREGVR